MEYSVLEYIKLSIYYLSYLYFLAAPLLLWGVVRHGALMPRLAALLMLAGLSVLAYARFVEPRRLDVVERDIEMQRCFDTDGDIRLALFADMHIGIFGNAMPIERIADAVRSAKVDAAVIAGDLTYFLHPDEFVETFRPLADVDAPVYLVLGNHDVGEPGPDVREPLAKAVRELGLYDIEDRAAHIISSNGAAEIVGLSDLWLGEQKMALLQKQSPTPRLVLTHNPDTVLVIHPFNHFDLMMAGHTHGGQINLGPVTCLIVPFACRVVRDGYGQTTTNYLDLQMAPASYPVRSVFVTTGTGMVGLPMRFNMPPRIDILNISYRACDATA